MFAGFQFGASFTPDNTEETGSYGGFTSNTTPGQQSDIIEIGGNFSRKFGAVTLGLSAGYGRAEAETPGPTSYDQQQWSLAGNIQFAGIKAGIAFRSDNQGITKSNTERQDLIAGIKYSTANRSVGFQGAYVTAEAGVGLGKDKLYALETGGTYKIGGGVILAAGLQYWDWQDNANAIGGENEAIILLFGTSISF